MGTKSSAPTTSKRPHRRKPPKIEPPSEPRKTELIGLTGDGRMVLWDEGMVQPIDRFPTKGPWIESGHYVIDWKGHAITVHCGNMTDGRIGVLFMCSALSSVSMPRAEIEPLLIGKVVQSDEHKAEMRRLFAEMEEMLRHRAAEPHRQRGRI